MTMSSKNHAAMIARIEKHGRDLLAIFPEAATRDPVELCKKLRRLEASGNAAATAYCNGDMTDDGFEANKTKILRKATEILGAPVLSANSVWFNGDPRGYALKIDMERGQELHRDWGGYGIIAPDLTDSD